MAKKKYDFAGWATKANMKCTDGRTIMTGAFKDDDGRRVPLIWNHRHDVPDNVLGHADLEYTDDGVMAYCSFNDSDNAQKAKALVEHGDITSLSIHANGLIQDKSTLEYKVTFKHAYYPVRVGDCVRLNYERAGLENVKVRITSQSIPCDAACQVEETGVFTKQLWGDL